MNENQKAHWTALFLQLQRVQYITLTQIISLKMKRKKMEKKTRVLSPEEDIDTKTIMSTRWDGDQRLNFVLYIH